MEFTLDDKEARVLGCLVEKELTTPEYYPLSLNALLNACNQKSSRDPVVSYDEDTVAAAVESLKVRHLAYSVSGSRADKYGHNVLNALNLIRRELAALCVLLLRGPQTVGELRGRTGRMYGFEGLAEVRETLAGLVDRGLVGELAREPGRKERRYSHLLCGAPAPGDRQAGPPPGSGPFEGADKTAAMELEIAQLRRDLEDLKSRFLDFKAQFE
jgi:uncharacterized protein YceH (UPF0502 family)